MGRKTVFIDRDGVINKDSGGWTPNNYVEDWKYFIFLPGSKKALKELTDSGYDIIVISNQAGVSKGFYSVEKLNEINDKMISELKKDGIRITGSFYCIHQSGDNCGCRKPETGLFRKAEAELNVKAEGLFFIGDNKTDVEAGFNAKMKTILILTGKTDPASIEHWEIQPDHVVGTLTDAVAIVLREEQCL